MDSWKQELERVKMVAHAVAYARRGWPVFPVWWPRYAGVCACRDGKDCSSKAKHSLVPHSHKDATTDVSVIEEWWRCWPKANIGIATGMPCGFTVLDIDPGHGGQKTFSRLMMQNGRPDPTLVSMTGGGGRHILWRWMPEHRCSQNIRSGIDVRSSGGYILAPPSLHASGVRYEWHKNGHPRNVKIARAPDWIESILRMNRSSSGSRSSIPSGPIEEGGRNMTLFRYACRFQGQGLPDEDIANQVHELNKKLCRPPLGDREVEKIIGSALRYRKGNG